MPGKMFSKLCDELPCTSSNFCDEKVKQLSTVCHSAEIPVDQPLFVNTSFEYQLDHDEFKDISYKEHLSNPALVIRSQDSFVCSCKTITSAHLTRHDSNQSNTPYSCDQSGQSYDEYPTTEQQTSASPLYIDSDEIAEILDTFHMIIESSRSGFKRKRQEEVDVRQPIKRQKLLLSLDDELNLFRAK